MGSQEPRGLTQRASEQGSGLASLGLIPQQLSEVSRVGWGWQPGSNKFPGHSQVCEDQSGLRSHGSQYTSQGQADARKQGQMQSSDSQAGPQWQHRSRTQQGCWSLHLSPDEQAPQQGMAKARSLLLHHVSDRD